MSIKYLLTKAAEKITGRKCARCKHNCGGCCIHPSDRMFKKCWQSITRPGFEKKPPRYLKEQDPRYAAVKAAKATPEIKPAPLTPEQKHQLEKIKATLDQAEETARESGLLAED